MPPLFALAAAPTTANQGGLDARRLLDRLYQETVGQPMPPPFAPQTWEALFCQQPPSLLHHPHPCHGFLCLG